VSIARTRVTSPRSFASSIPEARHDVCQASITFGVAPPLMGDVFQKIDDQASHGVVIGRAQLPLVVAIFPPPAHRKLRHRVGQGPAGGITSMFAITFSSHPGAGFDSCWSLNAEQRDVLKPSSSDCLGSCSEDIQTAPASAPEASASARRLLDGSLRRAC